MVKVEKKVNNDKYFDTEKIYRASSSIVIQFVLGARHIDPHIVDDHPMHKIEFHVSQIELVAG
jgi:hypothetical protein